MPLSQPAAEHSHSSEGDTQRLARSIDHTKLTFAANEEEAAAIEAICREAKEAGFFAVCVRPRHIALAKTCLSGSDVKVATVIGFPDHKVQLSAERQLPTIGKIPLTEKVAETEQAIHSGANELDLVIDVAGLKQDVKSGTHQVRDELMAIANASQGRPIKVIIETDLLEESEIVQVTTWCAETGMAMVKTSTGMVEGGQGATLSAVKLIADTLRHLGTSSVGIKASGGIKTRDQALAFLNAGVNRLGTSSGLAIVQGALNKDTDGSY